MRSRACTQKMNKIFAQKMQEVGGSAAEPTGSFCAPNPKVPGSNLKGILSKHSLVNEQY